MTALVKVAPGTVGQAWDIVVLAVLACRPAGAALASVAAVTSKRTQRHSAADLDAHMRRDIGIEPWDITWV